EPRELVLRIKRILQRKASVNHEPDALVIFGPFAFDLTTSTLTRDDVRIHITTAEQQLLANFANAPDTVLSRDDLSNAVEGRMEGRSIDVAVARLRRKLEPDPRHPVYLQTMRNRGWLLRTDRPPR
ncbi:MAG: DNA-binding response regulator, partial [Candidatus Puniceispirillum sp.]|nr:DNA-binding response regulator [Candidatus Puniceispirillum sp.]